MYDNHGEDYFQKEMSQIEKQIEAEKKQGHTSDVFAEYQKKYDKWADEQ